MTVYLDPQSQFGRRRIRETWAEFVDRWTPPGGVIVSDRPRPRTLQGVLCFV